MSDVAPILIDGVLTGPDADWIKQRAVDASNDRPLLPPIVTFKADIWRRATDEEVEVIEAQINAQALKLRNLFRDCDYLDHVDPYFNELKEGFISAFGEKRASELLYPSRS